MNKGATLMELLLTVVIICAVSVSIALIFPKSFKSVSSSRQRMTASNLLANKMEEIKNSQYSLIPRTAPGVTGYFLSVGEPGCDCTTVDWTLLPSAATQYSNPTRDVGDIVTVDGVTYTRQVCINLEDKPGGIWTSHCPAINENLATLDNIRGKNIRLRVSWIESNDTKTMDMEGFATR